MRVGKLEEISSIDQSISSTNYRAEKHKNGKRI